MCHHLPALTGRGVTSEATSATGGGVDWVRWSRWFFCWMSGECFLVVETKDLLLYDMTSTCCGQSKNSGDWLLFCLFR